MSIAVGAGERVTYSKKKRKWEGSQLEIDLQAPEPPSKKTLRKQKRRRDVPQSTESKQPSENTSHTEVTGKRSDFGIWIGNLPFSTTKENVRNFLTSNKNIVLVSDQITRIHLPEDKASKPGHFQNKGFAYVDLANAEAQQSALELNEASLAGRRVLIKDAKDFTGRPDSSNVDTPWPRGAEQPSKRIFVGNLGFDVTADVLKTHFEACGPVVHIHMATFEDSGKCKGFAWLEFDNFVAAGAAKRGWVDRAVAADTTGKDRRAKTTRIWVNQLEGRRLRLEYAEDKSTRYNKRFGTNAHAREKEKTASGTESMSAGHADED